MRLKLRSANVIIKCKDCDCHKYKACGFSVTDIHADNEFGSKKSKMH